MVTAKAKLALVVTTALCLRHAGSVHKPQMRLLVGAVSFLNSG